MIVYTPLGETLKKSSPHIHCVSDFKSAAVPNSGYGGICLFPQTRWMICVICWTALCPKSRNTFQMRNSPWTQQETMPDCIFLSLSFFLWKQNRNKSAKDLFLFCCFKPPENPEILRFRGFRIFFEVKAPV